MEKYDKIIELIYDFGVVTTCFPALICIFRWHQFDLLLKAFSINTLRGAVMSITALFFYYQGLSNKMFYYVGPSIDIVLISFIASTIIKRKAFSISVAVVSVIFLASMSYDYIENKTSNLINTQLTSLESLYVIAITLILLRIISIQQRNNRYGNSLIWLLSATLVSNLFSLLVSSLNEIALAYSSELFKLLWYVSSPLVIIITNGILCYGYLLPKKITKPS